MEALAFDWGPRTPAAAKVRVANRDYQVNCVSATHEALRANRSTLDLMATGTGKSHVAADLAADFGGCLFLAHRDFLLEHAADKIYKATGIEPEIEKAERRAFGSRFVCASVQTLHEKRLEVFARRHKFPLIIIDEGHRGTAPSYQAVYKAFPDAKLVFMTATADRADKRALGTVCDSTAFRYEFHDARKDAWLVRLERYSVECNIDLGKIRLKGGDLDQEQLDEELISFLAPIAEAAVRELGDWKTTVFTPGVRTAIAAAEAINQRKPGSAAFVHGKMDDDLKGLTLARHKAGEIQYLANCGVTVEGYDDPRLMAILDTAFTKSRSRAIQKIGRVLRPWPTGINGATPEQRAEQMEESPKPCGRYYDLTCRNGVHELAGPVDLLGGKYDDAVKKRAKKILDEEGGGDVEVALEEASNRIAEEAQALKSAATRASQLALTLKIQKLTERNQDPWKAMGVKKPRGSLELTPEDRPSARMLAFAQRRGLDIPGDCTKRQLGKLIGASKKRAKEGLIGFRAVKWLGRFGIDGRKMASSTYDSIVARYNANGKLMPARQEIDRIIVSASAQQGVAT